jgi:hypothetical protein
LTSHVIFSIQSITVIITVTLQPYLCSLAFEPAMSSSAFNPDHMPWSSMKWTEEAAKAYYEHRAANKLAQEQATEEYKKHKVIQQRVKGTCEHAHAQQSDHGCQ